MSLLANLVDILMNKMFYTNMKKSKQFMTMERERESEKKKKNYQKKL